MNKEMIERLVSSEEEKHVNDVCSALTEYVIGEWTYSQLVKWLHDNTTSNIKDHVLEMANVINNAQDYELN